MAAKNSKNKQAKPSTNREAARRTQILRIGLAIFSIMLILSMILSLTNY
jgi:hypothetical protein